MQKTREEQHRDIREELRTDRQELVEVIAARDYYAAEPEPSAVVAFVVAETILNTAWSRAEADESLRTAPPAFESKAFLRKLGQTIADPQQVQWTPELIHCGLALYANLLKEPVERFVEKVRTDVEDWAAELGCKVRRLEREDAALTRLLDGDSTRKRAAILLPGDGRDERIAKYERHLHSLLTSTLHELERLQARREGEAVPPPAVADVNVIVDAGPG